MTLEEALRGQLVGYAPLAALIGNRVYAMVVSETATLPAVTYQRISTAMIQHRSIAALGRVRFQTDAWATKYSEAVAIRAQVKAALVSWQRSADPRVDVAFLQDDRDLREATTGRYRASIDFMLFAEDN